MAVGRSRIHLHFIDEDIGARLTPLVGGQAGAKLWYPGSGVQHSFLYVAYPEKRAKGPKTWKTI